VEHYVPPFLQKETVKKNYKRSPYVRVQNQGNLPKKLAIFIAKILLIIFLLLKWILKNKIIIQHSSAEPEKLLQ
jgi:hypothetical protein